MSKTNAAGVLRGNIRRLTANTARAPVARARVLQRKTFAASGRSCALLKFAQLETGRRAVDVALRLDVLAVCAVLAFVTAILLGAF